MWSSVLAALEATLCTVQPLLLRWNNTFQVACASLGVHRIVLQGSCMDSCITVIRAQSKTCTRERTCGLLPKAASAAPPTPRGVLSLKVRRLCAMYACVGECISQMRSVSPKCIFCAQASSLLEKTDIAILVTLSTILDSKFKAACPHQSRSYAVPLMLWSFVLLAVVVAFLYPAW